MIRTFTSWRGLLAVEVVLFHYSNNYVLAIVTSFAMTFFFMVSGFQLAGKYDFADLTWAGYRRFMGRRLWRVYPLHVVVLALFALKMVLEYAMLGRESDQWGYFLPQLLLVQSWLPIGQVYLKLNGVSWFLSSIVFCYACYPVLVRWLRGRRLWEQVMAVGLALAVMMALSVPLSGSPKRWIVYICPLMRLVDFTVGIVLRGVYEKHRDRFLRQRGVVAELVAELAVLCLIGTLFVLQYYDYLDRFNSEPFTLALNAMLITLLAAHDRGAGLLGRVLHWRVLGWLGKVSYEVYMLQLIVLIMLKAVLKLAGISGGEPWMFVVYACCLLGLSWLWHKWQGRLSAR